MKWQQSSKYEWFSDGARIKLLTNPDVYYVYKNGEYLGSNPTLEAAQNRAVSGERSATYLSDELPGGALPAFLALSRDERRIGKAKKEEVMTEYKDMTLEALVRSYNESVEIARSKGLDKKPVLRFESVDVAIKANEQIESSIKAATAGARAEARQPTPKPPTKAELRKEGEKAVKQFKKMKKAEAKAKKAAAPAPTPGKGKTKPTAAPKGKDGFIAAIAARPGTNKEKLANLLFTNLGKSLPLSDVVKHIYGTTSNKAISAVIGGLKTTIKDRKLPYDITVKENKIGLHASGR